NGIYLTPQIFDLAGGRYALADRSVTQNAERNHKKNPPVTPIGVPSLPFGKATLRESFFAGGHTGPPLRRFQ
ncbi:MAG: hypothetical protein IJ306_07585, partial [Oscillospiraceae bacterium]|nr:hypothetical protein [Oscillospiraceae bacterium]